MAKNISEIRKAHLCCVGLDEGYFGISGRIKLLAIKKHSFLYTFYRVYWYSKYKRRADWFMYSGNESSYFCSNLYSNKRLTNNADYVWWRYVEQALGSENTSIIAFDEYGREKTDSFIPFNLHPII